MLTRAGFQKDAKPIAVDGVALIADHSDTAIPSALAVNTRRCGSVNDLSFESRIVYCFAACRVTIGT